LIQNGGQSQLTIGNVSVNGTSFSLVSQDCTQQTSVSWCTIQLSFAPLTAGALTGSVVISSNDPVNPQLTIGLTGTGDLINGVPSILANSAPTVLLNNGPTTLQLTGTNFYPQSVAQVNGVAQTTTFLDNGDLKVTIAASLLTSLGELQLSVVNPAPGGGSSQAITVTPYETLLIEPAAVASVPATGLLYAAIPASAAANPNTVIPVDPKTGTPGTPIPVGKDPRLLAASSDGAYLYVANQADFTLQRINLKTNAVERTFPYTPNIDCPSCSNVSATDLATIPGSPQEVLLSQGSSLTLYNDAGSVNYVPNDGICCRADPDFISIALAGNPLTIYGLPFTYPGVYFQVAQLTSSGLQYARPTVGSSPTDTTTGNQVISDGTLLYTSAGQVWDPSTQTQVGTFPVTTFNATSYPNDHNITLDTSLGEIYTVGDETYGGDGSALMISAYGIKSYAVTGTLAFPQINYPIVTNLIRWGADGLSFIGAGAGLTDNELYLLRSSVVSPQSANPTPTLISISPTSATEGGPAFTITANGTGFIAASVIDWNGSALPTTYVSASQLAAPVSAAQIASGGTVQVSVFSPAPGGGSSTPVAFAIVGENPAVTLSATSLDFGSLAQGVASTAQDITLTNSGAAPLLISGITASGDFSSTNTCGSSVAVNATCTIAVVFTPSVPGQRAGAVTIADNAASSPQAISLSGTGVAAVTIGTPSGSSTSATISSGGTATYNLSLTGATGYSGTVGLTCTGAPQYASCTISPSTLSLTSGSSGTFTVTVTTTSTQAAIAQQKSTITLAGFGLFSLIGFSWMMRVRRKLFSLCIVFLGTAMLAFAVGGCGGGAGATTSPVTYKTPAGTYTLVITAASGKASATQNLTLVVN